MAVTGRSAQYVGRCTRHGCGAALWVSGTVTFSITAGKPQFKCGRFKNHKARVTT